MASLPTSQTVDTTTPVPTTTSPIPVTTIGRSMYHLLDTGSFSDVSFRIGPTREEVKAHRVVLAAASEVFNAMFQERWNIVDKRKKIKNATEIDIPNTNPQAFKYFLKFLYVEEISSTISISDSFELLNLANQYDIPNLMDRCSADLLNQVNLENCLEIYQATRLYPNLALADKAFKLLTREFAVVVKSDQFLTADQATLKDLLRSDEVQIDEVDFFKALVRWGENKAKDRETPCSNSAMTSLLQLVRYPLMGAETFAKEVVPTNVLSSEAALEMLSHLNGGIPEADLKLLPAINIPRGNASLDCSASILLFDYDLEYVSTPMPFQPLFTVNANRELILRPEVRFKTDQAVTIYGVEVYGVTTTAVGETPSDSPSVTEATDIKNLPYVQAVYVAITSAATAKSTLDLGNYKTNANKNVWYIAHAGMAETDNNNISFEVLLKEPLKTVPDQWYWISASRDIHLSPCFNGYDKNYRTNIGWTDCDLSSFGMDVTKIVDSEGRIITVDLHYDYSSYISCSSDVSRSVGTPLLSDDGNTGCIRSLILNRRSQKGPKVQ